MVAGTTIKSINTVKAAGIDAMGLTLPEVVEV